MKLRKKNMQKDNIFDSVSSLQDRKKKQAIIA